MGISVSVKVILTASVYTLKQTFKKWYFCLYDYSHYCLGYCFCLYVCLCVCSLVCCLLLFYFWQFLTKRRIDKKADHKKNNMSCNVNSFFSAFEGAIFKIPNTTNTTTIMTITATTIWSLIPWQEEEYQILLFLFQRSNTLNFHLPTSQLRGQNKYRNIIRTVHLQSQSEFNTDCHIRNALIEWYWLDKSLDKSDQCLQTKIKFLDFYTCY